MLGFWGGGRESLKRKGMQRRKRGEKEEDWRKDTYWEKREREAKVWRIEQGSSREHAGVSCARDSGGDDWMGRRRVLWTSESPSTSVWDQRPPINYYLLFARPATWALLHIPLSPPGQQPLPHTTCTHIDAHAHIRTHFVTDTLLPTRYPPFAPNFATVHTNNVLSAQADSLCLPTS